MRRFKLFIENFIIYGFGGIIGKLFPIILLPVIIRIMPDSSYYGISDLVSTLTSIGSAIAVMGMNDAMYRMFFEKEDILYRKSICSTTLFVTCLSSFFVFFMMILGRNSIAYFFFNDKGYAYLVCLAAIEVLIGSTNAIMATPTRMQNNRGRYLLLSFVNPLISYSIAIWMLLNGYYVIAILTGSIISSALIEVSFFLFNKKWFSIRYVDLKLIKHLLYIAFPLLLNSLSYWVFNSSDKIMLVNFLGTSATGIYSAASKLGHCSQLIQIAFSGGWQYFAFSTMKEKDQVKVNSLIYEYLGTISLGVTMLVCALSSIIFKIFFTEEYQTGYILVPYLFIAPLLQMLFQVASNQFLVIKKTWPIMLIMAMGALMNIIMNCCFIPTVGAEGAAIATLLGYILVNLVCIVWLKRVKLMEISRRFVKNITIFAIYFFVWRFLFVKNVFVASIVAIVIMFYFFWQYKSELIGLMKNIKEEKKSRIL